MKQLDLDYQHLLEEEERLKALKAQLAKDYSEGTIQSVDINQRIREIDEHCLDILKEKTYLLMYVKDAIFFNFFMSYISAVLVVMSVLTTVTATELRMPNIVLIFASLICLGMTLTSHIQLKKSPLHKMFLEHKEVLPFSKDLPFRLFVSILAFSVGIGLFFSYTM